MQRLRAVPVARFASRGTEQETCCRSSYRAPDGRHLGLCPATHLYSDTTLMTYRPMHSMAMAVGNLLVP
jgi:hypothetical protein